MTPLAQHPVPAPPPHALPLDVEAALDFRMALRDIQAALRHALDARLAAHGITCVQGAVLEALRREPSTSLAEIAHGLRLDAPSLSRLVGKLEAKGLCLRFHPHGDRRAVRVELLPAGIEIADAYPAMTAEVTDRVLAGFAPDERRFLFGALHRMLHAPADA